jgi:hypothetical protein
MTSSMTLSLTRAPLALDERCINTLRSLAVNMMQRANPGQSVRVLFEGYWSAREDSRLRSLQFGRHGQEAAPENGRVR